MGRQSVDERVSARHFDERLCGVESFPGFEPEGAGSSDSFSSYDFTAGVVNVHVVIATEKYSVSDVRFALVSSPLPKMVGFRPGDGFVTTGISASAISYAESDSLAVGEESLLAAHVEEFAVVVEEHSDFAVGAEELLEFRECNRSEVLFEEP